MDHKTIHDIDYKKIVAEDMKFKIIEASIQ